MNFFSCLAVRTIVPAALLALAITSPARAQDCNTPAKDVVTTINLPGEPASIIPTKDGCTFFISMHVAGDPAAQGHIAVLRRAGGKLTLTHDIPVPGPRGGVSGMAISHDGKWLVAADQDGIMLFDTSKLLAGDGKPVAQAKDPGRTPNAQAGSNGAIISPDDRLLFVSDEGSNTVTVYDLAKLIRGNTTAIGEIPVGNYPTGGGLSPDGRKLYVASQEAPKGNAPTCSGEDGSGDPTPQGLLVAVDVTKAASDPAGAVLVKVAGGCDPVRAAVSADGRYAMVTNRSANTLSVFDTAKLASDRDHALTAAVPVGKAPVGVLAAGPYILTSDSNRFIVLGRKNEWLSVIDPTSFKVIGNIPAGLFPRTLTATADGKTLLVPNADSDSIELVDLARLTPAYLAKEKALKDADDAVEAKALTEHVQSGQAAPGTEAALRHLIEGYAKGTPDYAALLPEFANIVRLQGDPFIAGVQKLGALQSIAFKSADQDGRDTFEVTFANAKTGWRISLSPDGKAALLGFSTEK